MEVSREGTPFDYQIELFDYRIEYYFNVFDRFNCLPPTCETATVHLIVDIFINSCYLIKVFINN